MAQESNTFSTYDVGTAGGNRDELSNIINNIDPTDVPFYSKLDKRRVRSTKPEWLIDELAAASTSNAKVEGYTYAYTAATPTVRVGNYTQISDKDVIVTETQEAVDSAGRSSDFAYLIAKRGKELKRDIDSILLNNQASVAGDDSTARKLGGFPAWLTTNVLRGTGGADGGWNNSTKVVDAATDGTTRDFTLDHLAEATQLAFDSGGTPNVAYMGSRNKRRFSGFEGIATNRANISGSQKATIFDAADMYVGDFGEITTIVERWMRQRDVLIVDHDYVGLGTLRPIQQVNPAKVGDNMKKIINTEYTLIVDNEAAHAQVADLNT